MASSILDEKLAEGARKYPVLYYKRCADKLKKTLGIGTKNRIFYYRTINMQQRHSDLIEKWISNCLQL